MVDWLATDPTGIADDDLITGDLNSYAQGRPDRCPSMPDTSNLVEMFDGADMPTAMSSTGSGAISTTLWRRPSLVSAR
jgi:predicted extracellular nuclease